MKLSFFTHFQPTLQHVKLCRHHIYGNQLFNWIQMEERHVSYIVRCVSRNQFQDLKYAKPELHSTWLSHISSLFESHNQDVFITLSKINFLLLHLLTISSASFCRGQIMLGQVAGLYCSCRVQTKFGLNRLLPIYPSSVCLIYHLWPSTKKLKPWASCMYFAPSPVKDLIYDPS